MPRFRLRDRFGGGGKQGTDSSSKKSGWAVRKGGTPRWLPSLEDRLLVRERVIAAATAVFVHHVIRPRMDLEEDPDLSRNAKAGKRQDQFEALEAYKHRLQTILLGKTLSKTISTCLHLDPEASSSCYKGSPPSSSRLTSKEKDGGKQARDKQNSKSSEEQNLPKDVFGCVALLLCNYILLVATENDAEEKYSKPTMPGYDARIRNILRMASIDLIAEDMEKSDMDGRLMKQLEKQRKVKPMVNLCAESESDQSLGSSTPTTTEDESHDMELDSSNQPSEVDSNFTEGLKESNKNTVHDNLYRQYATKKFQALEQGVAEMMTEHILQQKKQQERQQNRQASDVYNEKDSDQFGEKKGDEDCVGPFSPQGLLRAAKIGGVGVVAGTLFAVTGGLAAPGIAAGLAAIGVGGTIGALVTSHVAVVALFGLGGGGLSAYKMKRRTDGLAEFNIVQAGASSMPTNTNSKTIVDQNSTPNTSSKKAHLHTTVCVSGWLKDENDYERPWGVDPPNLGRVERLQRFYFRFDRMKLADAKDIAQPFDGSSNNPEKEEKSWQAFCDALRFQYQRGPYDVLPIEEEAVPLSSKEQASLDQTFSAMVESEDAKPTDSSKERHPQSTSQPALTSTVTSNHSSESAGEDEPFVLTDPQPRVWDYQTEYGGDLYTIQWESRILLKMCQTVNNMALQLAKGATQEVLKKAALTTILSAMVLPAMMVGLADGIDSDWTLVTIRSDLAGIELAKSLLQSDERRPVNLIGQSFGGRVVVACLEELARHQEIWEEEQQRKLDTNEMDLKRRFQHRRKRLADRDGIAEYKREPASIVQDVIIMGTPLFVSRSALRSCRRMVAGRFVNCYSTKDWILALMFQYKNASSLTRSVYGTAPVDGISSIENYDVTGIVSHWHPNYCHVVPEILDLVGFDQPMVSTLKDL